MLIQFAYPCMNIFFWNVRVSTFNFTYLNLHLFDMKHILVANGNFYNTQKIYVVTRGQGNHQPTDYHSRKQINKLFGCRDRKLTSFEKHSNLSTIETFFNHKKS